MFVIINTGDLIYILTTIKFYIQPNNSLQYEWEG